MTKDKDKNTRKREKEIDRLKNTINLLSKQEKEIDAEIVHLKNKIDRLSVEEKEFCDDLDEREVG